MPKLQADGPRFVDALAIVADRSQVVPCTNWTANTNGQKPCKAAQWVSHGRLHVSHCYVAITMSWICYWYVQKQSEFYPCMHADVRCVAVQLQVYCGSLPQ